MIAICKQLKLKKIGICKFLSKVSVSSRRYLFCINNGSAVYIERIGLIQNLMICIKPLFVL